MFVPVVLADVAGDDEAVVFVEGDEGTVEGFVVGGGEAEAVAGVHAGVFAVGPGDDVTGNTELGEVQAGDATAVLIAFQNHFARTILKSHRHRPDHLPQQIQAPDLSLRPRNVEKHRRFKCLV